MFHCEWVSCFLSKTISHNLSISSNLHPLPLRNQTIAKKSVPASALFYDWRWGSREGLGWRHMYAGVSGFDSTRCLECLTWLQKNLKVQASRYSYLNQALIISKTRWEVSVETSVMSKKKNIWDGHFANFVDGEPCQWWKGRTNYRGIKSAWNARRVTGEWR